MGIQLQWSKDNGPPKATSFMWETFITLNTETMAIFYHHPRANGSDHSSLA